VTRSSGDDPPRLREAPLVRAVFVALFFVADRFADCLRAGRLAWVATAVLVLPRLFAAPRAEDPRAFDAVPARLLVFRRDVLRDFLARAAMAFSSESVVIGAEKMA
jgi:hypothetical protein